MTEGFAIIPNWMIRDTSIGWAAKQVYLVLTSHAGRDGSCFPSQALIADEAGMSDRQVRRALAELKELGVVTWSTRVTPRGRVNVYLLSTEEGVRTHSPDGSGHTVRMGADSQSEEEEPVEEEPKEETPTPPALVTNSDWFTKFAGLYPRFEKPKVTEAAWDAAIKQADPEFIVKRLRYLLPHLMKDGVRYVPPSHVWLNDERWRDNVRVTEEMRMLYEGYR